MRNRLDSKVEKEVEFGAELWAIYTTFVAGAKTTWLPLVEKINT